MNVLNTLKYLKRDIKVVVWSNDIDQIQYHELETFRPTKKEILAVDQAAVETFIERLDYASLRAAAYPTIGDQLDMIYKDSLNGTTMFKDAITAVKSRYPK